MPSKTIDQLIINSPYSEPAEHWKYDRESRLFSRVPGRRDAGYVRASGDSKTFDDPGIFVPLELPNKIRPRIKSWRESGYPGVSGITKRLLEHWRDPEQRENHRLFFCQLEAIETLIWLIEGPPSERVGSKFRPTAAPSRACAPRWPPAPAKPSLWPCSSPGRFSIKSLILKTSASRKTFSSSPPASR